MILLEKNVLLELTSCLAALGFILNIYIVSFNNSKLSVT